MGTFGFLLKSSTQAKVGLFCLFVLMFGTAQGLPLVLWSGIMPGGLRNGRNFLWCQGSNLDQLCKTSAQLWYYYCGPLELVSCFGQELMSFLTIQLELITSQVTHLFFSFRNSFHTKQEPKEAEQCELRPSSFLTTSGDQFFNIFLSFELGAGHNFLLLIIFLLS